MKSQWLQAVIHKSVLLSFLLYLIPKQDALQKSIMHATWSEEAGNTNLFTHSTHVGEGGSVHKEHLPGKQSIHAGYYYSWSMAVRGRLPACLFACAWSVSEHLLCKLYLCFSCWVLRLPALMGLDKLPRALDLCSIYEAWLCLIHPHWSQVYAQPVLTHCACMHDG